MSPHVLDTSAVLAHVLHEAGHAQVQELLDRPDAAVFLAAPSLVEMEAALRVRIADRAHCRAIVELYADEIAEVLPADRATAMAAIALRNAAAQRLPAMDALIAGCAVAHDAILVHRDPHFDAIPPARLKVLRLPDTEEPPTSADVPAVVKEPPARYNTRKTRSGRRR